MGIDTAIAVVNRQFTRDIVASDAERFREIERVMEASGSEFPVGQFVAWTESIRDMQALLEGLEAPPAVNTVDLDTFYYAAAYYPTTGNREMTAISLIRNSTVVGSKIPEFLASRSERAAGLWAKLAGKYYLEDQYEELEPPYQFRIDGEVYSIEPETGHVGFLQGDEIEELADELRPYLPEVNQFYESLDDKYRKQAEWAAPFELVYSLATCYGGNRDTTLLTHTD